MDLQDILKGIFERALKEEFQSRLYDLVIDKTTRPNTFDLLKDVPIEDLTVDMKLPFSFCGWRREGDKAIFTIENLDGTISETVQIALIP